MSCFYNQLQRPNLLNKKITKGELLRRQTPGFLGLAQLGDHFEYNMQLNLRCEALFIHLRLWRLLRQRWGIVLRFDNQLQ
jgi:hypothetical protein